MDDMTGEDVRQALMVQRVCERLVQTGHVSGNLSAKECVTASNTVVGKLTELGLRLEDLRDEIFRAWPFRLLLRFVDWFPGIQRRPWGRDL
jgi:hypothetical protein